MLEPLEIVIIIGLIMVGTMITRFLPFIIFPENKETPKLVKYLGNVLTPAMMGLLVVYCLRSVTILSVGSLVPNVVSIAAIVILHKWKNNVLLSIGVGTVIYLVLVQVVF